MKRFGFFAILLMLLVQMNCLQASEKPQLEFGIFKMIPFYNVKDGQSAGGICTDIMENVLQEAQYPYEIKVYPASRLYHNLATGKTDVFVGIKDVPAYKEKVLFSREPVSEAILGVYTFEKKLIQRKEDLIGKRVIVVRGYAYGGLINFLEEPTNKILLEVATTHEDGLKMIKGERADYFLDYTFTVDEYLKIHPMPELKHSILSSIPLHLIVSKATPNAEEIMDHLDQAWNRIRKRN